MKNITTTFCAAVLTLAPASLLAQEAKDAVEKTETKTEAKAEETVAREIAITCADNMQYDKNALELKAGETVKITLKNIGKAPKIAMGHNLVILKPGANLMAFATKAGTARENDYIPTDKETAAMMLVHTKLLGPDETDSIIFTPKEAGKYEYVCSFPGHFALMRGVITVK